MAEKTTVKTTKKEKKTDAVVTPQLLAPRATEKTYRAQTERTYAFFVDPSESKQSVAARVASDYNVVIEDVRILTRKGKKCKFSKGKHAYPGISHRRDRKLAYVRLAEGNSIAVFQTEDSNKQGSDDKQSAEPTSAKKTAKASAKDSAKEDTKAGKETK